MQFDMQVYWAGFAIAGLILLAVIAAQTMGAL